MRRMSFGAHSKTIARRIRTALLLSALLLFGSLHGAEAGVNVWTTNGPEGGSISALAVDPQTPTSLYAGTTSAGVFKSIDGGTHWRAVNAGLGATSVRALAIDPQTPTALYAAFWGGGVFKSTDGGANWSNISSGLIDPYGVRVSAIADRKSTRLNSSHSQNSHAVFCLKKKIYNDCICEITSNLTSLLDAE